MDIALLRTFLEVARTRHFGNAANNLFVTQSAVSARIKLLESTLGVDLFDRRRNDIRLTPAGERLSRHAEIIVRSWGRAKAEVALRDGQSASVSIGGVLDLWQPWLQSWVTRLRLELPDVALHLEIGDAHTLIRKLGDGSLDLAFVLETSHTNGLHVTPMADVPLRLYATEPQRETNEIADASHISVDWGGSFNLASGENESLPAIQSSRLQVSQGSVALDLLGALDGSAYLPEAMAQNLVEAGRLYPVADAPEFKRQIFAMQRAEHPNQALLKRILGLF
ncbi:MAG: LysR family transcriptional regulator [Gammaproteobacteria bacterium]|nr:LysR family transcriptional regulator [Gammaproteobacteria bacterium]MCP5135587.1 LysR family transcriptional regulator [Gammaproteobacteria bacterium]